MGLGVSIGLVLLVRWWQMRSTSTVNACETPLRNIFQSAKTSLGYQRCADCWAYYDPRKRGTGYFLVSVVGAVTDVLKVMRVSRDSDEVHLVKQQARETELMTNPFSLWADVKIFFSLSGPKAWLSTEGGSAPRSKCMQLYDLSDLYQPEAANDSFTHEDSLLVGSCHNIFAYHTKTARGEPLSLVFLVGCPTRCLQVYDVTLDPRGTIYAFADASPDGYTDHHGGGTLKSLYIHDLHCTEKLIPNKLLCICSAIMESSIVVAEVQPGLVSFLFQVQDPLFQDGFREYGLHNSACLGANDQYLCASVELNSQNAFLMDLKGIVETEEFYYTSERDNSKRSRFVGNFELLQGLAGTNIHNFYSYPTKDENVWLLITAAYGSGLWLTYFDLSRMPALFNDFTTDLNMQGAVLSSTRIALEGERVTANFTGLWSVMCLPEVLKVVDSSTTTIGETVRNGPEGFRVWSMERTEEGGTCLNLDEGYLYDRNIPEWFEAKDSDSPYIRLGGDMYKPNETYLCARQIPKDAIIVTRDQEGAIRNVTKSDGDAMIIHESLGALSLEEAAVCSFESTIFIWDGADYTASAQLTNSIRLQPSMMSGVMDEFSIEYARKHPPVKTVALTDLQIIPGANLEIAGGSYQEIVVSCNNPKARLTMQGSSNFATATRLQTALASASSGGNVNLHCHLFVSTEERPAWTKVGRLHAKTFMPVAKIDKAWLMIVVVTSEHGHLQTEDGTPQHAVANNGATHAAPQLPWLD